MIADIISYDALVLSWALLTGTWRGAESILTIFMKIWSTRNSRAFQKSDKSTLSYTKLDQTVFYVLSIYGYCTALKRFMFLFGTMHQKITRKKSNNLTFISFVYILTQSLWFISLTTVDFCTFKINQYSKHTLRIHLWRHIFKLKISILL